MNKIDQMQEQIDILTREVEKLKAKVMPKQKRFTKPEQFEVAQYMTERGCLNAGSESQDFIDHYSSNGWKVGKNPMKDWKAAVRNWLKPKGFNGNNKQEVRKSINNIHDISW